MLDKVFLSVLNMSLTGSFVILIILLVRLFLRRLPRQYSFWLWGIATLRLILPFSFESARALLPVKADPFTPDLFYTQAPQIESGVIMIDRAVNTVIDRTVTAVHPESVPVGASVNPIQIVAFAAEMIWIGGILLLAIYHLLSLFVLVRRLWDAEMLDGYYVSPSIEMPFVLGLLRPRIYLPQGLSAEEREMILMHERAHIRRFDHLIKLVGFFVLILHWFNPLVWVAFRCFERDMEMSCDERVMREMNTDCRREYSALLLGLATGRRRISPHLAFGESDIGARIRHILRYHRPAVGISVLALLAVIVLCVLMLFNPVDQGGDLLFSADMIPGMRFVDGRNSYPTDSSALDLALQDITVKQVDGAVELSFVFEQKTTVIRAVPISHTVRGDGWRDTYVFAPEQIRGGERFSVGRIALDLPAISTALMNVNAALAGKNVLSIQLWETESGDLLYWQGEITCAFSGEPAERMETLINACLSGRSADEISSLIASAPLYLTAKKAAEEIGIIAEGIHVPSAVLNRAIEQVQYQFEKDIQTLPYQNWRLNSLSLDYTYDASHNALGGRVLEIYRFGFDFYTETPNAMMMAGGMIDRGDGWIGVHYLNSHFIVYDPVNEAVVCTLFSNDSGPGEERFTARLAQEVGTQSPAPSYTVRHIVLPTHIPEQTFVFSIPLPADWTVEYDDAAETSAILLKDGEKMGGLTCTSADWIEGGEGNYGMYFQGYLGGSIVNWGINLRMIRDNGDSGIAATTLAVNQMTGATASESPVLEYPALLAYLRIEDKIMQVAVNFAEDTFTDEILDEIARNSSLILSEQLHPDTDSAISLWEKASEAWGWFDVSPHDLLALENGQPFSLGEGYYLVDRTRFSDLSEVKAYLGQLFSRRYIEQELFASYKTPLFREIDGSLGIRLTTRGTQGFTGPQFVLREEGNDRRVLTVTYYVLGPSQEGDGSVPRQADFIMIYENGGWVFDLFPSVR